MGKKLYVGNLPFGITDQDLNQIFAEVGQVTSAKVIMDRETGRSKGFGFVEMSSDEEAAKAISQFDGGELEGRQLRVNEARGIFGLVIDELHPFLVTLRDRVGWEDVPAVIQQKASFRRIGPVEQQLERREIVIPIWAHDDEPTHILVC